LQTNYFVKDKNIMKRNLVVLTLVLLLSLAITVPALADATVTISPGSLSVTAQGISFGTVTLNGTDQTVFDGDVSLWQAKDPTGTGSGWHATIAAADFSDGTHTISASNLKTKLEDGTIVSVAGNTAPTSSVTAYTALSATPQTFLSAASGAGMGTYTFVPDFSLDVAAETYAGSYTSTVTVAIISGP
jgi:WxL domain surface cell wall-binding